MNDPTTRRTRRRERLLFPAFGLLLVLGMTGCGQKTGTVLGKVTYLGKPLPSGVITFMSQDERTIKRSNISEDGSYKIEQIPVGSVKVMVATIAPPSKHMAMPGMDLDAAAQKYLPIPGRYRDPVESQLTYTVVEKEQTHHIDLK